MWWLAISSLFLSDSGKNKEGTRQPSPIPRMFAYAPAEVEIILSLFGNQFAETLAGAL
jgi:hypothetical protein